MRKGFSALLQSLRQGLSGHGSAARDADDDPPAWKLVDSILRDAATRRASEIQIGWWARSELGLRPESEIDRLAATMEGGQEGEDLHDAGRVFAVRHRIAGELNTAMTLPRLLYPSVVSRLKEIAGLTSVARYDPTDAKQHANPNAPRGHFSRRFSGPEGSDVRADFDVTIVALDHEEKALLSIAYPVSPAK